MKIISSFLLVFLCLIQYANSQTSDALSLEGAWVVDLKPTPDAAPYLQDLIIEHSEDGRFSGSFYSTPFSNGETNSLWEKTYFAFSTKDGRSTYFSSGYIEGGKMNGVTYCDNRNFVMPWIGIKQEIKK